MREKKKIRFTLEQPFFTWVLQYFIKYPGYYVLALSSLFLLHLLQSAIPKMLMDLPAKLVLGKDLWSLSLLFLAMALLIIVFRTVSRWFFFYPARKQQMILRIELIELLSQIAPARWTSNYSTGKIYQFLMTDLDQLRAFIGFALLQTMNIFFAFAIILPKMSALDSRLMWSLLPLLITFLCFMWLLKKSNKFADAAKTSNDELQQIVIEHYDAKKTLNSFHKEENAIHFFAQQSMQELSYFRLANNIRSYSRPLIPLGVSLAMTLCAYQIYIYQLPMKILVAYSTFLFLLMEPLVFVSWLGIIYTDTLISWRRLTKIFFEILPPEQELKSTGMSDSISPFFSGPLALQIPLWCQDPQAAPISRTLQCQKNQRVMICGDTGCGKTTFLQNLAIQLRSQNILFSLVPQDPYLFDDSILNNLLLGQNLSPGLLQKIAVLLKILSLEDVAATVEEFLAVQVGERGKKLSGGQIKRVHLMRSLIGPYEILLWDDPFSAVDVILEKQIMQLLIEQKWFEDKFLIFTSHRVSSLPFAQEVILLEGEQTYLGDNEELRTKKVQQFFERQSAIKI